MHDPVHLHALVGMEQIGDVVDDLGGDQLPRHQDRMPGG